MIAAHIIEQARAESASRTNASGEASSCGGSALSAMDRARSAAVSIGLRLTRASNCLTVAAAVWEAT